MPKRKNIVGQVFGELTVVEMLYNYQNKHRTYCRCIGIDKKEYIVRQDALISGATNSIKGACSGGRPHDITGQRFGKLVAIEPIDERASNGSIRWKCLCDCGGIVYPTINNLKRGHTTSCGCAKEDYINSLKSDMIGMRFGKLIVREEIFPENRRRRMFLCDCDCGNNCIKIGCDLSTGHAISCGCLEQSKGELYIQKILSENNIKYTPQKRFDDCRNIRSLPFDFYLDDINYCLEYDGRQHSEAIEFFGGEEGLRYRQQNDKIKTDYCNQNNIGLIRIPYTMSEDEILKTILDLTSPATITAI